MNNIFYGHAPLMNGLFLLNLGHSDTHIHNIDAKRYKVDNDSATYLWHCRLGHIGVKRMKKLHAEGLLESLEYESFVKEICPRGNNKVVIYISLYHDKCLLFMLELY